MCFFAGIYARYVGVERKCPNFYNIVINKSYVFNMGFGELFPVISWLLIDFPFLFVVFRELRWLKVNCLIEKGYLSSYVVLDSSHVYIGTVVLFLKGCCYTLVKVYVFTVYVYPVCDVIPRYKILSIDKEEWKITKNLSASCVYILKLMKFILLFFRVELEKMRNILVRVNDSIF